MNNKGFAISGILYTILIIFVVSISIMLFNLQNRKTILDELKTEAVEAVESDNNYEYLLDRINQLESEINGKLKYTSNYIGYTENVSLENAIATYISNIDYYIPSYIHGVNITGLPISSTNDVTIEVIRYGETDKNYTNWYRAIVYDNQSNYVCTITNLKGSFTEWSTVVS